MHLQRLAPIIITLAAFALLWRGGLPLIEPEEARYAEIPRQMLQQDRWIVPVFDGQAYLDKPPLFYWLIIDSFRAFGVSIAAARLVPTLACLGTVLLTYWWGLRLGGWRVGA